MDIVFAGFLSTMEGKQPRDQNIIVFSSKTTSCSSHHPTSLIILYYFPQPLHLRASCGSFSFNTFFSFFSFSHARFQFCPWLFSLSSFLSSYHHTIFVFCESWGHPVLGEKADLPVHPAKKNKRLQKHYFLVPV